MSKKPRRKPTSAQPSPQELNTLLMHYNAGDYAAAERCARALTQKQPDHAFAWKALGAIARQSGRLDEALLAMHHAARLAPQDAEAHNNLGVIYRALGRLDEAQTSYRESLRLKPEAPGTWVNLGNALKDLGRLSEAEECFRQALHLQPDNADAHNNLGNTLRELHRPAEAEVCYRNAIRCKPNYAEAHNNLGNALLDLGKLTEAQASYATAIHLKSDYAEAHSNLGNVLKDLGLLDAAQVSQQRAIELKPDYAEAYSNLGNVLAELGCLDEAENACRQAIALNPGLGAAHSNLGNVLRAMSRLVEAEASYREATRLLPHMAEIHSNLGNALKDLGLLEDAQACYREAMRLQPSKPEYAYKYGLMLPDICASTDSIVQWRERYKANLLYLMGHEHQLENPARTDSTYTFYLAYHNHCDAELMTLRSALVRKKVRCANHVASHIHDWRKPNSRKIRVGFCSQFLVGHTIGKLYQGLIKHLDRSIFEVIIIHASGAKRDGFSAYLDGLADKVIQLGVIMSEQVAQISAEQLDILFYPEIGMSPETWYLAHARLAPVQVVSWGHPDTTGIDTLDYFVSSSLLEPDDADQHYTERLVRLSRLPCYYQPWTVPTQIPSRAALGLPTDSTLYGCPQSLFKFHPDFDAVLAEIVARDPAARLVLIDGVSPTWSNLLKQRWAARYPGLIRQILFLPRQPVEKFMALIAHMDVLLDPIHFGSGNTMYESMAYGVPTVTWPGRFMRGRCVAGAYRQMGAKDAPIARNLDEYAALAADIGANPERRATMRNQLLHGAENVLYADLQVVREFEAFFLAAIESADRGEKLPQGWMPIHKPGNRQ